MGKTIYYTDQKELEGMREVAKAMDFGVALCVMWAFNEMLSSYGMFMDDKHRGLFSHNIKKLCNKAIRISEMRALVIKSNMKDRAFWEDYSDAVLDAAGNDVTLFRLALKKTMDDAGVKYAELYAYVECARVLLDLSVKYYDTIIENGKKKYGRDWRHDFVEFHVGDLLRVWTTLCKNLYVGTVDLNSPAADLAFKVMCKKFAEGEYISECLEVAHSNNPEFIESDIIVKE